MLYVEQLCRTQNSVIELKKVWYTSLKLYFMLPAGFHVHCKTSGGSTQNINDV
jgi:hypothetical protein